ncbi:MAG TPA: hypothetical protein VM406_05175 [Noviherbaspirillum sp.]|nr:hypothetical protein [Noviherbaspirillum sp.]
MSLAARRVLVAADPRAAERIIPALGPDLAVNIAHSLHAAKAQLDHRPDLIVCALYFDDSRMFDLLRHLKADEATRGIPFIAVKTTEGALSTTLRQGIEIACAALGAEKFVDYVEWEQQFGAATAREKMRSLARRLRDE